MGQRSSKSDGQRSSKSDGAWSTVSVEHLLVMDIESDQVVHVTGFGKGMPSLEKARLRALEELRGYSVLTFGGDKFHKDGFTVLVRDFLAADPTRRVIAFRHDNDRYDAFKESWNEIAKNHPGSFRIVKIDVEAVAKRLGVLYECERYGPAAALKGQSRRFFLLGRLAVKMMKTKRVIAIGGGGIAGFEMQCGLVAEGARWTVFALSRGEAEKHETLMDVASKHGNVELVRGFDDNEAQAFKHGLPANAHPKPDWRQAPAAPRAGRSGTCADDMTFVKYMELNFAEISPKKTCEEYMRNEVCAIQAMAPTAQFMDDLLLYCGEHARRKMQDGINVKYPNLTYDNILAAAIFTFEVQAVAPAARDENEFYRQYNNALRQRDGSVMGALAGYSHYLFSAVQAMPVHKGILWRGIRGDDPVQLARDKYADHVEIHWSAWSSASVDRDVARDFATMGGSRASCLIRIESVTCARDITELSALPNEHERVIHPNASFVVTRSYHMADDGIGEIHLTQLAGKFIF